MELLSPTGIARAVPAWANRGDEFLPTVESCLARYDESHRRYHDRRHVVTVVSRCVELLASSGGSPLSAAEQSSVVWAALWHDAVYDPRSISNEAQSAQLASVALTACGALEGERQEVERLILLTAGHQVGPDDRAGAILVDADLAVLGASSADYAAYVEGVREEYEFLDDDVWRIGRARVLRSLIDLTRLFHTAEMAPKESVARTNLAEELRALTE